MKKLLVVISIFCFTLVSGIVLSACGESATHVISVDIKEESLVELTILNGKNEVELDANDSVVVEKDSNITVKLHAMDNGVDFSGLTVKVNGQEKSIFTNKDYDPFVNGDLYYGWLTLPMKQLKGDVKLNISGAKKIKTEFAFEGMNIEDEDVVDILENVEIKIDRENGQFENFYTYLTGENKTFTKEYDGRVGEDNPYRIFEMRFVIGEQVVNDLYDMSDYWAFKLRDKEGQEMGIRQCRLSYDGYLVDLGDVGKSSFYTIVADFKGLKYKKYTIEKPEDNFAYKIELQDEEISFDKESVLTINGDETMADFSNVSVKLNNKTLEKIEEESSVNVFKFKIPKGLTPSLTGGSDNKYLLAVEGLEYKVSAYNLKISSTANLVSPKMYIVNESEDTLLSPSKITGNYTCLENQKFAMVWSYPTVGEDYNSAYDLYDYVVEVNNAQLFKLKDLLENEVADVARELEGGYIFKATYNTATGKFDNFRLEFNCSENMNVAFKDFVLHNKSLKIGYDFDDINVENVYFAHITKPNEEEWKILSGTTDSRQLGVVAGDTIAFKLQLTSEENNLDFTISNPELVTELAQPERIVENGKTFLIYRFEVSEKYFENVQDFKLVKVSLPNA